jgi:hypothetical protein
VGQVEWARNLAQQLLEEPLPRRWAHSQGVAARAETLRRILGEDADLLVSAAWLHDIGYSPDLVVTGFHPLDGARYLRDTCHAEAHLCCLVAHHSGAIFEAEERSLARQLTDEFPWDRRDLSQALIYCDMTIDPNGAPVAVERRLSEILSRYGEDHIVTRSIQRASTTLTAGVRATEHLLLASR